MFVALNPNIAIAHDIQLLTFCFFSLSGYLSYFLVDIRNISNVLKAMSYSTIFAALAQTSPYCVFTEHMTVCV